MGSHRREGVASVNRCIAKAAGAVSRPRVGIRALVVAATLAGCGGNGADLSDLSKEELDWCDGTTSGFFGPTAVREVSIEKGRPLTSESYYNEETREAYIEDCREAYEEAEQ